MFNYCMILMKRSCNRTRDIVKAVWQYSVHITLHTRYTRPHYTRVTHAALHTRYTLHYTCVTCYTKFCVLHCV